MRRKGKIIHFAMPESWQPRCHNVWDVLYVSVPKCMCPKLRHCVWQCTEADSSTLTVHVWDTTSLQMCGVYCFTALHIYHRTMATVECTQGPV